jgi:hypothetical protein
VDADAKLPRPTHRARPQGLSSPFWSESGRRNLAGQSRPSHCATAFPPRSNPNLTTAAFLIRVPSATDTHAALDNSDDDANDTMATKEFTYSDVSEHTTKKDCYIVVHDKVYDASSFVDEHP